MCPPWEKRRLGQLAIQHMIFSQASVCVFAAFSVFHVNVLIGVHSPHNFKIFDGSANAVTYLKFLIESGINLSLPDYLPLDSTLLSLR